MAGASSACAEKCRDWSEVGNDELQVESTSRFLLFWPFSLAHFFLPPLQRSPALSLRVMRCAETGGFVSPERSAECWRAGELGKSADATGVAQAREASRSEAGDGRAMPTTRQTTGSWRTEGLAKNRERVEKARDSSAGKTGEVTVGIGEGGKRRRGCLGVSQVGGGIF